MPLTATLQSVETNADSADVSVRLEYPGMAPETRPYKFRSGADLLAANVAAFILATADRVEALVARGLELRAMVGQDCYLLLNGEADASLEAVLQDVAVTYDAVTLSVRVTHRPTGRQVIKGVGPFTDAEQMTADALRVQLAAEGTRLASLNDIVPAVLLLTGVDLVAWARAGAPVPGEGS